MKMRIAILAACASTLALAQADVARANYGAALESKSLAWTNDNGPSHVIREGWTRIAQRGKGCGHGPGNDCRSDRYPPEQVSDPGWCESHFVVDRMGVRRHQCPPVWNMKEKRKK